MARLHNRLSTAKVANARAAGMYADGGGLYLQISEGGARSWVFRYKVGGRSRYFGLGPVHTIGLAEARALAMDCRRQRLHDVDPIEQRKARRIAAKEEAARAMTFDQCRDQYIASHKAGWRNSKHAAQWTATLKAYVTPVFGALPVASIDTALVTKALMPIWSTKTETASRVRGRIERILNWATTHGFRTGENPARWKGHLDNLLPHGRKVRRVEHHPALAYTDIPQFMADLRGRDSISARALEFLTLTAGRTEAVIGATWDEIDLKERIWKVPPTRDGAKMGEKPRRVPLCDRALAILKDLPRERGNPHVFVGGKSGHGLSNMAMAELLKGMAYPSTTPGELATVHGMRSAFKDWAAERTSYPNEVSEAALWHAVADKVEAAYRRGDLFEKRRRLMDAWAGYCGGAPAGKAAGGKVVDMNQRRSA